MDEGIPLAVFLNSEIVLSPGLRGLKPAGFKIGNRSLPPFLFPSSELPGDRGPLFSW
jgi:hypothetical protein